MPTLLTIRPPEGEPYAIAIDGHRFIDPPGDVDTVIETAHLWALPGLADAHAHLTMTRTEDINGISEDAMRANIPAMSWAHLENGVLLILDKGGTTDLTVTALDHDADLRPHVEVAGAIIHPRGGYMTGFGTEVEPEDLIEYLRNEAVTRGGWVKLAGDWPRKGLGPVSNYPTDLLADAVEVVHAAGARLAIHTMAASASDAVAAGVDSIEHGPFLTARDIHLLAEQGGAWVPTLVNMLKFVDILGADSTGGRMFLQGLERMRENLPLAEELGVVVLAGTDMAVPQGQVAQEAVLLNEYGMSNRGATRATSIAAYDYVGKHDAIRPGESADVVFFPENPYDDVSVLTRPEIVIRRGRIINSNT